MLFVLISTYLGVWGCAYMAAHSWRSRLGFWTLYAVALGIMPLVSALGLSGMFRVISPDYAASITPLSIQIGMLLALIAYPIKYLRAKDEI